jgi:hypothetical protein
VNGSGGGARQPAQRQSVAASRRMTAWKWTAPLLRQVRAAEALDAEGRQWSRTKRSDDATAVYLFLANG